MFALVKARRAKKRQKDSSKHVGEPSKGGCSRPRDMICRQHEFVMGHHRDPTVRYLAIALLTYRRLRPSSRCSQSSVNTGERIFLSTISSTKKRSKHSVSKHLSDALDYLLSAGQKIRPRIFGAGRRHRPHEPPARPFSAHVARPEQA